MFGKLPITDTQRLNGITDKNVEVLVNGIYMSAGSPTVLNNLVQGSNYPLYVS